MFVHIVCVVSLKVASSLQYSHLSSFSKLRKTFQEETFPTAAESLNASLGKLCMACGTSNRPAARFCRRCGQRQSAEEKPSELRGAKAKAASAAERCLDLQDFSKTPTCYSTYKIGFLCFDMFFWMKHHETLFWIEFQFIEGLIWQDKKRTERACWGMPWQLRSQLREWQHHSSHRMLS